MMTLSDPRPSFPARQTRSETLPDPHPSLPARQTLPAMSAGAQHTHPAAAGRSTRAAVKVGDGRARGGCVPSDQPTGRRRRRRPPLLPRSLPSAAEKRRAPTMQAGRGGLAGRRGRALHVLVAGSAARWGARPGCISRGAGGLGICINLRNWWVLGGANMSQTTGK